MCEGDIWRGRKRRSIDGQVFEAGLDQMMVESQGLLVERELIVEDRLGEIDDEATDFSDNIGFSVIMPGREHIPSYIYHKVLASDDYYSVSEQSNADKSECTTFLIFGILMGCLLIVASVMMCLLAHRLNRMAMSYKVILKKSSHLPGISRGLGSNKTLFDMENSG